MDIDSFELFRKNDIKKLNKEEADSIEDPITYHKSALILKAMSNINMSPGSDGFSADFFLIFWKKIGHFVVCYVNYGFSNGDLSITQREGIITCIPKDNKSRNFVKKLLTNILTQLGI